MRGIFTVGMVCASLQASFLSAQSPAQMATLTVSGHGQVSKPADEVTLQIGVVTTADTAEAALIDNNQKMQGVIDSVDAAGLTEQEFKTGQFSIRPLYSHPPKGAQPDWKAEIVGYEITNAISIKTDKIKLAGDLIDTSTHSGANRVESVAFNVKDTAPLRTEAIKSATQNAIRDAGTLSKAAGVTLRRILSVSLDEAKPRPLQAKTMALERGYGAEGVPLEPGIIEVHATVTIEYEIG